MFFNKGIIIKISGILNFILLICFLSLLGLFTSSCEKKKKVAKATLKISSNPKGATVFINNKEYGETPMPLRVSPSIYIIKFSKSGYEETWEKVVCPKNSIKTVDVTLKPITASVMFTSNPKGAKVLIDNSVVGETPLVLQGFKLGRHTAIFRLVNHAPQRVSWEIDDQRPERVHAILKTNVGKIQITSKPKNANIFIDGEPRGRTPFKGAIEEGTHKIRFELQGYTPQEQIVVVKRGQTTRTKVDMAILPGTLKVTSTPSGARLYIAGKHYGNTPRTIKNLSPGVYMVRVEKGGFDHTERKVTVMANQTTPVNLPLSTNMGGIDLVVNPPGVTIYLDGKKVGVSEPGETPKMSKVFHMRKLTSGRHIVTLAHKRAKPAKRDIRVNVKKGQITRRLNEEMWIADHKLTLKTGIEHVGRLIREIPDKNEIEFEPEPKIKMHFKKQEIKSLTPPSG